MRCSVIKGPLIILGEKWKTPALGKAALYRNLCRVLGCSKLARGSGPGDSGSLPKGAKRSSRRVINFARWMFQCHPLGVVHNQ